MVSEKKFKAFPIIILYIISYVFSWQPEFLSNQPQNLKQSLPLPKKATRQILKRLAYL